MSGKSIEFYSDFVNMLQESEMAKITSKKVSTYGY